MITLGKVASQGKQYLNLILCSLSGNNEILPNIYVQYQLDYNTVKINETIELYLFGTLTMNKVF